MSVSKRRALASIALATLGVVLGAALTWLGERAVEEELSLRASGTTVDATVTGARVSDGAYELTYGFQVAGSATIYGRRDDTGRRSLWVSLSDRQTWEDARARGTLAVAYLPEDPWVNRPVAAGASPLGDPIAGLVLGLFIALPCSWLLRRQLRRAFGAGQPPPLPPARVRRDA